MSQYDEIMQHVPVDQLAQEFGVDQTEVTQAAEQALPALLGGLHANADDPAGADSILNALTQHAGGIPTGLDQVDAEDGQQIVSHIFGGNTDEVINRLGGSGGGTGGGLIQKLLPILAPIVMSWLASRLGGSGGTDQASGTAAPSGAQSSGGLQDVLGSILGGQSGSGSSGDPLGGLLGGVLGGLLGGGRR